VRAPTCSRRAFSRACPPPYTRLRFRVPASAGSARLHKCGRRGRECSSDSKGTMLHAACRCVICCEDVSVRQYTSACVIIRQRMHHFAVSSAVRITPADSDMSSIIRRQHATSSYVSMSCSVCSATCIRQHTSAYGKTPALYTPALYILHSSRFSDRDSAAAYVCIYLHTSAYVSDALLLPCHLCF
jgi:hypothetical protein